MHHRKLAFWLISAGVLVVIAIGILFLLPAQPVSAQCGSQASSCKNCHETQAKDPVNNDGTAWHVSHAFGDFCYLCHGGNNQAADKTAAHTGMVDPLADIVTSCKSCHATDYQAKAQIYATTLGVKIGATTSTSASTSSQAPAASTPVAPVATAAPAASQPVSVPAADMVDYSQRYNEIALGIQAVSAGNVIVIVLIVLLVLGGGFFVARREGWFKVSFQDTKTIQGSYPVDIVDLVPEIAKLKPDARKNLRQILAKPATAAELFALINKISSGNGSSAPEEQSDTKKE